MLRSKFFWIAFGLTAIFGVLAYPVEIRWIIPLFWVGFGGLIFAGLAAFVIGLANAYKEQSYGIVIGGIIALTLITIWTVWMLLDINSKGWNW